MTLHDSKTGRFWTVRDTADAYRRAARLGLKEWMLCPDGTEPDTIRKTVNCMGRRTEDAL